MSYHAVLLVEVDAERADAVDDHGDEHDEDLDHGDPVGEVGPVVVGVAAEFPLPVRLGGVAGDDPPPAAEDAAHHAHAVLAPVRVVEGRVQEAVPDA